MTDRDPNEAYEVVPMAPSEFSQFGHADRLVWLR
jgi:hypothetical protein